jgi:hypothetical protein
VAARDGGRDTVACGDGRDAADADKGDRLAGCESRRAVKVVVP